MIKLLIPVLDIYPFFLSACNDADSEAKIAGINPDAGKSCFSKEEGEYREYDVYETRYPAMSLSYQLKGEPGEAFTRNGVVSNIIYRFTRIDEN